MATITLRTLGGLVVMTVPRQILSMMRLGEGSQVDVNMANGKLVVKPKAKPHYTLAELLASCNQENMALTGEDREWLAHKSVGKEVR